MLSAVSAALNAALSAHPQLKNAQATWTISGRVKSLPSTFRKVFRQGKPLSDVLDVLALRVVIDPIGSADEAEQEVRQQVTLQGTARRFL